MMNNIIVTYDLQNKGQDYVAIIDMINALGDAVRINRSVWYLKTNYSVKYIIDHLIGVIDYNDQVFVADMIQCGWSHLPPMVSKHLEKNWNK